MKVESNGTSFEFANGLWVLAFVFLMFMPMCDGCGCDKPLALHAVDLANKTIDVVDKHATDTSTVGR